MFGSKKKKKNYSEFKTSRDKATNDKRLPLLLHSSSTTAFVCSLPFEIVPTPRNISTQRQQSAKQYTYSLTW